MHSPDIYQEFDIDMDLSDPPGAAAPGPQHGALVDTSHALDGVSARRMAVSALLVKMTDREVWAALNAINRLVELSLREGRLDIARRAVAQQDALTRELQRRAEERR